MIHARAQRAIKLNVEATVTEFQSTPARDGRSPPRFGFFCSTERPNVLWTIGLEYNF